MKNEKNPVNKLFESVMYTILGTCLYGMGALGCFTFGIIAPNIAIFNYVIYGLMGIGLGFYSSKVLKKDIKDYKNYKNKQITYHKPFPINEDIYEKRLRYQIDREKNCKVEDFYKSQSDYPSNFIYEKEDQKENLVLTKKYRG